MHKQIIIIYYNVDQKDQILNQIKTMRHPNKPIKVFGFKLDENAGLRLNNIQKVSDADIIFIEAISNRDITRINQLVSSINRGRLKLKSKSIAVVCHKNVFSYRHQNLWVDKFTSLGIQTTIIPIQSLVQDLSFFLRDLFS